MGCDSYKVHICVDTSNGATQAQAGARSAERKVLLTLIKVRGADFRATIPRI